MLRKWHIFKCEKLKINYEKIMTWNSKNLHDENLYQHGWGLEPLITWKRFLLNYIVDRTCFGGDRWNTIQMVLKEKKEDDWVNGDLASKKL